MSEERKIKNMDKAIELMNKLYRDLVPTPTRTKSQYIYYDPPKDWGGTVYRFAYTPWRTQHEGKEGFFALKYRMYKKGGGKLVKATRFGRRKIAHKRALTWYQNHYGVSPR